MAVITSHTLNGTDGTHAAGISVTLTRLGQVNEVIFTTVMDAGGRLEQEIAAHQIDPNATYELVFETGPFWSDRNITGAIPQIVLRFLMPDQKGQYHMPVILSPNSYTVWRSC
jgi:5-hydroxyisourate hydrolase|tara:strand:+ start:292 stop:630 length:339 start_codon:yes stop_codon:yes gene_type:complete